jgi:hypothetical protein
MNTFKTPLAAVAISASRIGNSKQGDAAVSCGNEYGTTVPERIYMCARIGEDWFIESRLIAQCSYDFCGGMNISSMQTNVVKRPGEGSWNKEPIRLWDDTSIGFEDAEFTSLVDVTKYLGDEGVSSKMLHDYLYWSMANAVLGFARYYQRTMLTCSDRSYEDSIDYEELMEEEINTAALMAKIAELGTVHSRLCSRRGTVGSDDTYNHLGSLYCASRFDIEAELSVTTAHNRNSGNLVGVYVMTGAHGNYWCENSYDEDDGGCEDRVYNEETDEYEDCGECNWCEYNHSTDPAKSFSREESEMYKGAIPTFKRNYWFNG